MGDFLITAPDGKRYKVTGDNAQGALAALRKSLGDGAAPAAQAPAPAPAAPEGKSWLQGLTGAAAGIVNDIGGAFQGVNPIAASKAPAVGVLRNGYVDVDGTHQPMSSFPPDRFSTRIEGGVTYVVPKRYKDEAGAVQDTRASRAESAGRVLGYGLVDGLVGPTVAGPTQKLSQAAQDIGVTPSFAMRGPVEARIAAAGEQFAPTAGRFAADAQRLNDELGFAAAKIADKAGPGINAVDAGEALQRGAQSFVNDVKSRSSILYGEVDKAIPPSTPIAAPKAAAFIRSKIDPLKDLPEISKAVGNSKIEAMLKDLESGNLSWTAARQLRTDIGESFDSLTGPLNDVAGGKLKGIYGALSDDLAAAADAAGPKAAQAWSRATSYTRASHQRIEQAFTKILKADSPEKAYASLTAMATEGTSSANVQALHKLLRSLPAEEASIVSGTIIRRLGRAAPGTQDAAGEVFSPAVFLTNWNRMSPEARAIIGRSGLDKGVGQELNKLAVLTDAAKRAGTMRNHSNTSSGLMSFLTGGAFLANPVGTSASVGAAYISARALTNKTFLEALNKAATGNTTALQVLARGQTPLAIEAANLLRLQAGSASQPLELPAPALATR